MAIHSSTRENGLPAFSDEPVGRPREAASISKGVRIDGWTTSDEPLYVNGDVDGTLELRGHRLTVGPTGRVQATVWAKEVVVLGAVHGVVNATDKILIRKSATVTGELRTACLLIEEGASFNGNIQMVRLECEPAATPHPQMVAQKRHLSLATNGFDRKPE